MKPLGEPAESCLIIATREGVIIAAFGDTDGVCGWQSDKLVGERIVTALIPRKYRMAHIQGITKYHTTGKGPVLGRTLALEAIDPAEGEHPVWLTVFAHEEMGRIFGYLQKRHLGETG